MSTKNVETVMRLSFMSLMIILYSTTVFAQYKLDDKISFIYINGTSTLHDWTAIVGQMEGTLNAEITPDHISKLEEAKISIPVISLKSGKEVMDENMYRALKSTEYPVINYNIVDYSIGESVIEAKGDLTIAGVTKSIESKITYQKVGKHIKFYGTLDFAMSEYNIDPPEFLFGAFKTGDKVSLKFYFMFCNDS